MTKQQPPKITQELKTAVETFLLAKAYLELVEPIVHGYQREILAEMQPRYHERYTNGHGRLGKLHGGDEIITDPDDTWEMGEDDFRHYLARCHEQHLAHGFDVEPDYCPLLIAKKDLSDAQRLVLSAAQYITGLEPDEFMRPANGRNGLENYYHAVDLAVGLVLSLCPDIESKTLMERVTNGHETTY